MLTAGIKLLVIEDDRVDQLAFKRFFNENSRMFDYRFAGSIAEARELLDKETFDIVITDYMLGDGTGLEVFEYVHDTPTIVITGHGDEEIAVNALKAGAYDYLIKDLERKYIKMLPITVENVLKRKKAEETKIQRDRLQGVIEVAGAACHELNQPLQAISGYSELLLMEVDPGNPVYEMAQEIKKETDRMALITKKLNNITRYETVDYIEGHKIIDIYKASGKELGV